MDRHQREMQRGMAELQKKLTDAVTIGTPLAMAGLLARPDIHVVALTGLPRAGLEELMWISYRRCRRAGPGRGAAGQHHADDAVVRLGCGCGCGCGCYLRRCGCVAVSTVAERGPPRPWLVLTLAHGQPWWQQHRRCRRAGLWRGAAGQHDVDDAGVRLACGCGMRRRECGRKGAPVLRLSHGQPLEQQQHRR